MIKTANIKSIFTSIQGEGPYIGVKQLFVRFCGCNLACSFCDTDFKASDSKIYTVEKLIAEVDNNLDCHSISLTGGEPLLQAKFLKEFLPKCKLPVYLETNATLSDELIDIINYVDYISADIKIPSATGERNFWEEHDRFFSVAKDKKLFAKVVFNEKITDDEVGKSAKLAQKYGIELILQPQFNNNKQVADMKFNQKIFDKYLSKYKRVRLVPQVHKFLDII